MQQEILNLFKVMVVDNTQKVSTPFTRHIDRGIVLDFRPTVEQVSILTDFFKPLDIRTLFTREERDNADIFHLISKQILHYIEIYGVRMPGLFDLEVMEGQIITMNFISGVNKVELGVMVRNLLYSNAPIKDVEELKAIITGMNVGFDINKVANNELRVALFDVDKHTFNNGDDAVRYMCYQAMQNPMLIKSREVIAGIKESNVPNKFLEQHKLPLAQVFNRHKKLILAAKKAHNRTVINQISHLSKTKHIPIRESVNKRFISEALQDTRYNFAVLEKISLRDKFKFLNLLAYKRERMDTDAFIIRNGKLFVKGNRKIWLQDNIQRVENAILDSLKGDLNHLTGKKILLDANVKYGLPTSRKQTIGQLPFGTKVIIEEGQISSGMYWQNDWGANDLDLSIIDTQDNRTGWGTYSGYDQSNPVTFSGDIVNAPKGAMEFMTSQNQEYGIFVNIYSGEIGAEMELVVGYDAANRWIEKAVIREKYKLNSRQSILGFIRNREFTVYAGRQSNRRVSSTGRNPLIARGMADFWNINDLFAIMKIDFSVDRNPEISYDYNLKYEGFSYDKLEKMLFTS